MSIPLKVTTLIAFSFIGSFKNALDYTLSNLSLIGEPQFIYRFDFPRRNILITPLFCLRIIFASYKSDNTTLLLPRGNSRLILLLLRLSAYKSFITYSDGLGDCMDDFVLADHPKYNGHIGFKEISKKDNLIISVPFKNVLEGWREFIKYSSTSPPLLIIKIPKEIDCTDEFFVKFYNRIIKNISTNDTNILYISCSKKHSYQIPNKTIINIGNLSKLNEVIYVSSIIGLPSTIFLSIDQSFPTDSIKILTVPSKKQHPATNKRTKIMAKLATDCRTILCPK